MNTEEGELRILPYVTVLHAFCVVDPSLCAPASNPSQFVVTLQPYLKNQVSCICDSLFFSAGCLLYTFTFPWFLFLIDCFSSDNS